MTLQEYTVLANKTNTTHFKQEEWDKFYNCAHSLFGMINEVAEISKIQDYGLSINKRKAEYLEELGDFMWFLSLYIKEQELEMFSNLELISNNSCAPSYVKQLVTDLSNLIGDNLVKVHKRQMFYGKVNSEDRKILISTVTSIINIVSQIAGCFAITGKEILELNIQKLALRYPDRFDSELSINRNLSVESDLFMNHVNQINPS